MRTLRVPLIGAVILALLGGFGSVAIAQASDHELGVDARGTDSGIDGDDLSIWVRCWSPVNQCDSTTPVVC